MNGGAETFPRRAMGTGTTLTMSFSGLVRWVTLCGLLVAQWSTSGPGVAISAAGAISLLALNTARPIALLNLALAYNFLVLEIGPMLVSVHDVGAVQLLGIEVALAVWLGKLLGKPPGVISRLDSPGVNYPAAAYDRSIAAVRVAIAFQIITLTLKIASSGLSAYTSGLALSAGISSYAAGGLGFVQIIDLGAQVLTVSAVGAHAAAASGVGRRPHWPTLILAGLIIPALSLNRSGLLQSTIMLLGLAALSNQPRRSGVRSGMNIAALSLTFVVVGMVSIEIGSLRQQAIDGGQNHPAVSVWKGEFAPASVVDYALGPTAPRFHGAPLVLPTVSRFVPRRLLPSKPPNTTARFMQLYSPQSFAAGYSLAPTLVGALVLNFGVAPTLVAVVLLSTLISRSFDQRRTLLPFELGIATVLYANVYPILRDDPANSIPDLIISLCALGVSHAWISRPPRLSSRWDAERGQ